tara:strand:- start:1232 stop:1723 length:492 start_codon:yes stop_codon:yes gene_type:complete
VGEAKRSWIAYLLWFLCVLGVCGAHRFYVGEIGWGVVYLLTFGFCGIGQFIDLFTIPGMVRRRNLVDRALSEDLKNDAIRNATMVISGINAANRTNANQSSKNDAEKIILDLLEDGKRLSVGRITAMADLPYSEVKKELKTLVMNGVLKEATNKDGTLEYYLP